MFFSSSKFIQDKYDGYSQKEAAYIAGAVYDSSLVLSASVGILIVSDADLFPNTSRRLSCEAVFEELVSCCNLWRSPVFPPGLRGSAGHLRRGLRRPHAARVRTLGLHLRPAPRLHHLAGRHLLLRRCEPRSTLFPVSVR